VDKREQAEYIILEVLAVADMAVLVDLPYLAEAEQVETTALAPADLVDMAAEAAVAAQAEQGAVVAVVVLLVLFAFGSTRNGQCGCSK